LPVGFFLVAAASAMFRNKAFAQNANFARQNNSVREVPKGIKVCTSEAYRSAISGTSSRRADDRLNSYQPLFNFCLTPSSSASLQCSLFQTLGLGLTASSSFVASLASSAQYASDQYQALLAEHGFVCSMSRKGNCWDNAVAERFF
jgi:hypothetical protein